MGAARAGFREVVEGAWDVGLSARAAEFVGAVEAAVVGLDEATEGYTGVGVPRKL